jgi:hypothetical protein
MGRLISLLAVVLTGAAIALSADLFRMAGFSLYTEQVLAGLLAIATPLIFLHVSAAGERGRAGAVPWYDLAAAIIGFVAAEYLMSEKPGAGASIKSSGQLKIIRTVTRRSDLAHSRFKEYWLKNHSKLEHRVIAQTAIQRIVATFALPEKDRKPDFDGMARALLQRP